MNVVYLWGGEEKRFEFSKNFHLLTSKLNWDRFSNVSVYIASHNMSQQQMVVGQLLMLKKLISS